ncbi:PA2169 family four-helix-bundle protein [Mesonia sp.]|uniref:ferritin-like domain-containing protein n=1 Tax=Mesonia sp. TaxID=1960830 RepID=UPI001750B59C|nr:PA2169 family four-helix-bundle protein [Mesonia sp.]HIB36712.1 PA2169 family four-helix-bundle protein [Mesonia sp.]
MKFTEEVAKKLNNLLEKNYDAEKGYQDAAERIENPAMKDFLQKQAEKRYDFGHEIKAEIKNYGEQPDKGGSAKGTVHRAWMDIKAFVASSSEEQVMEEVQRGEQSAINEYNEVISETSLPPSVQQILTKQRDQILKAQQSAKNFEVIS